MAQPSQLKGTELQLLHLDNKTNIATFVFFYFPLK